MQAFLEHSKIIDFLDPQIQKLAKQLSKDLHTDTEIAGACFNYVRDEINHSGDHKDPYTTCIASDVLKYKTGWCYAKSHLLAALLRANKIPAGFCYQRLSISGKGAPYSLHGLNAIYLKAFGWYRVDARGNKKEVDAKFMPPHEYLAFAIEDPQEEYDDKEIYPHPLEKVIQALSTYTTFEEMRINLPDIKM